MARPRLWPLAAIAILACESAPPPPESMRRRDAGPCELIAEVCNGEDDDCNGVVDDVGEVELCDGLDQDCDGTVDEGAACTAFEAPGAEGWQVGPTSSGVIVTDDGALTLEPPRVDIVQPALWIANSGEGTVSRLDPETGREVGRYPSATESSGLFSLDPRNAPSRTALDQRLDAYVANRAFDGQASVSKIAGDLVRCVDRDMDGTVETSRDLDGDGVISLDPMLGEFFADDECVLWTVPIGDTNAVARALAIGLAGPDGEAGDVWVGLFNEQRAVVLSQLDGHEIASIPIGISPYGAVSGADGRVWFTSGPGGYSVIVGIDPETYATDQVTLPGTRLRTYGISVDGLGRIVLAANDGAWRGAIAYDPRESMWTTSASLPSSGGGTTNLLRGIAASADAVWIAGPTPSGGVLFELAIDDLSLRTQHTLSGVTDVVGVGVAFDGRVWGIARDTSRAYRLDRETGVIEDFPTGNQPYTYSDFTGFGLNGILGAIGLHRATIEGCDSAIWTSLTLDADIPPETEVQVRVRSAASAAELTSAPWFGPFTAEPTTSLAEPPGPVPAGRFLELSLRLWSSTPGIMPRVRAVSVAARCDDVG
jgi:streptogramin lyase